MFVIKDFVRRRPSRRYARIPGRTHILVRIIFARDELPYRLIKSRWLVGTDDLFTVETIQFHSSRVSKFWILVQATQSAEETYPSTNK